MLNLNTTLSDLPQYNTLPAAVTLLMIGICGTIANIATISSMVREMTIRSPFLLALALADGLSSVGFVYTSVELIYSEFRLSVVIMDLDHGDGTTTSAGAHQLPSIGQLQYECGYKMICHLCVLTASSLLTVGMGLDHLLLVSAPDRYLTWQRRLIFGSTVAIAYGLAPCIFIPLMLKHDSASDELARVPFCTLPMAMLGRDIFWGWIQFLVFIHTVLTCIYTSLGVIARIGFRRNRKGSSCSLRKTKRKHSRLVAAMCKCFIHNHVEVRQLRPRSSLRNGSRRCSSHPDSRRSSEKGRRVSFDRFSIISKELRNRLTRAVIIVAVGDCLTWTLTLTLLIVGASLPWGDDSNGDLMSLPTLNAHILLYAWVLPSISNITNAFIYYTGQREHQIALGKLVNVALPAAGRTAMAIGRGVVSLQSTDDSSGRPRNIWQHRTYGHRWATNHRYVWRNTMTLDL